LVCRKNFEVEEFYNAKLLIEIFGDIMTKIKFCGLTRLEDIEFVNELTPDYIGFVFFEKSRRRVTVKQAAELKKFLDAKILSVGVFVNEKIENVAEICKRGIIDAVQLHGNEDENYIAELRTLTDKIIIKAFKVTNEEILKRAETCTADYVLLDGGAGDGKTFDWQLLKNFPREYFLAGGLTVENVGNAIKFLNPYAVDVSSGIETGGVKDFEKMRKFIRAVGRILND